MATMSATIMLDIGLPYKYKMFAPFRCGWGESGKATLKVGLAYSSFFGRCRNIFFGQRSVTPLP